MSAPTEVTPPPPPPEPAAGGWKKMLVLVLVAVLIVAGLAAVVYIVLSSTNPPGPAAVKLDHVTISAASSVDQAALLTLSAVAVDTKGAAQTANAVWRWTASPAAAVNIIPSATPSTIQILAKQAGSVTITANATWNNSAKEAAHSVTINALAYELTPSDTFPLVNESFVVTIRVLRGTQVVASYVGNLTFSSNDPGAKLNTSANFTIGDAGQKSFTGFALSRAGPASIIASDTVAAITGSTTVNGNRPPVPRISITANATNPLEMTANGMASSDPDGNPLTFLWDLGDGAISANPVVTHTYASAGPYLVALTVTDSHAVSNSTNQTYHAKAPPIASFRVVSESSAGLGIRVSVDASNSRDPDGTIVNYNWSWGDGNYSDSATPTTSYDYGPFWVNKDVTIRLRVTDNDALNGSTSQLIRVTLLPLAPSAAFVITRKDQLNRTVYVDARNSTDLNGNLASYNWSWGDGMWTNLTVPTATASHAYLADGDFVINLTVKDTTGLSDSTNQTVQIREPPVPPTAVFTATRSLMQVAADASASLDLNGNIASYTFDWGDGITTGPQTSPLASHTYSSPGAWTIRVTVTDTTSLRGSAAHTVSVARSTLDYSYHDFFNVPYGEWWDFRYRLYGDLPINADCFNRTSTTDRVGNKLVCTASATNGIPDFDTYPYTNWYPLPGQIRPGNPTNNPLVYAPYRLDIKGVNVSGYNRSEPVFLPVLNYSAQAGSRLDFKWYMQYLDVATANALTAAGCPGVDPASNDGFMIRSQIWLTLDLQESKRIFGVPSPDNALQAQTWWNQNTNNACGSQIGVENTVNDWFTALGNGKYDVYNSFEYAYTPFYTNITAKVDSDGTTHVFVEHAAWATEVLLARMFYWGNASYIANYLDSTKARGWWGMELAWFEDMNFQGTLGPPNGGFNFTLSAAMQYHFQLLTDPKTGGFDRIDDAPYWTWGPILTDYTTNPRHPATELNRYPSPYYGYIHSTPGSARYGQNLSYDYAPIRWDLAAGQTWHFQFPSGNVVFYDPDNTPLGSDPRTGAYVEIHRKVGYDSTKPGSYGVWHGANMTWDVYGPANTGGPVGNAGPDGVPGNTDDRYALEPWGALKLKTGAVAALAMPSEASMASSSLANIWAISPLSSPAAFTTPSAATAAPVRAAFRSRLE